MSPPAGEGRPAAYVRLVLLAGAIGIPAAFLAAVFLSVVHIVERWLWSSLPASLGHATPPWYLVLGLPFAGGVIVLGARRLLPGDGGASPLVGLSEKPTPFVYAPGVVLAALGTLPFGAVLGPEMPVIALGSAVGMVLVHYARLRGREAAVLSTAGSFSAISALFGGPIVAGVMLTEGGIGLGEALIPALLPGFVAAALGYLVFVGFGNWGGLGAPGLAVPNLPPFHGVHAADLLVAIAVGAVTTVFITAVRRASVRAGGAGERHLGPALFLLGGGLAVGAIAIAADALGANSQDVLFSGQASIPALVGETSTGIVLLLLAAKALAYVVSLSCGFRGGPIFPALFLGIGVAELAQLWFGTSPTLAVAIGAAAGMTAQTRLLLSAILFAALLVGPLDVDVVPAAVIAAASAWLTLAALDPPKAAEHAA
ncbi:MAG TPA: chloride channel protein [Gaiellaceae bacterium]